MAEERPRRSAQAEEPVEYIVVELSADSGIYINLEQQRFIAGNGPQGSEAWVVALDSIIGVLPEPGTRNESIPIASHFDMSQEELDRRANPWDGPAAAPASYAYSGFVQILPADPTALQPLLQQLTHARLAQAVRSAWISPRMVEASGPGPRGVGSFELAQGYLCSAPSGLNVMAAWAAYGAQGQGVTVCDIEGNWELRHSDLPRNILDFGGVRGPQVDHGTAALGLVIAKRGAKGTAGICFEAQGAVRTDLYYDSGGTLRSNVAAAIVTAAKRMRAGDVILMEYQIWRSNGAHLAGQYRRDIFVAIEETVRAGIAVIEPAGNGNQNFDATIYNGTGLQQDAGAIVVGAGVPPTDYNDAFGDPFSGVVGPYQKLGPPRSRAWFSNYGRIVNVQAWGYHVTTLGYGDLHGAADPENSYTLRFRGTSSASAIIAGAAACVQSHAKAKLGGPLPPTDLRDVMIKTGTAQEPKRAATEHIGPQPDVYAVIASL